MALTRCRNCKTPICNTCDFVFPGKVHICPACATKPSEPMGLSRKHLVGWSLGIAASFVLLFMLASMGVLDQFLGSELGSSVFHVAMQTSVIVGFGMAIGAIDMRASNPPIVWVTVVWNSLTFAAFALLLLVALMSMAGGA
jgi:hypothetical protein